ncbi:hypothetical protein D3C73_1658580 [compost metagenome]
MLDHFSGVGCLLSNTRQALSNPRCRLWITLQSLQVALAGARIVDHCRQRLVDLMGNA